MLLHQLIVQVLPTIPVVIFASLCARHILISVFMLQVQHVHRDIHEGFSVLGTFFACLSASIRALSL